MSLTKSDGEINTGSLQLSRRILKNSQLDLALGVLQVVARSCGAPQLDYFPGASGVPNLGPGGLRTVGAFGAIGTVLFGRPYKSVLCPVVVGAERRDDLQIQMTQIDCERQTIRCNDVMSGIKF